MMEKSANEIFDQTIRAMLPGNPFIKTSTKSYHGRIYGKSILSPKATPERIVLDFSLLDAASEAAEEVVGSHPDSSRVPLVESLHRLESPMVLRLDGSTASAD